MPDWDAARYHELSDPQRAWGRRVMDRLAPVAGERTLDIGCGTGRLTSELYARVGVGASIAAVDRSSAMVKEARAHVPSAVPVVQADALALPFCSDSWDAVFSTATFHWVSDHELLFAEIHRVLRPGGRLVSQAGGGPNLETLYTRTAALARSAEFAEYFTGWTDPWTFAGVEETRARLQKAGFVALRVWLEPAPTSFDEAERYAQFVTTVCLRHQLHCLPEAERASYVERLTRMAAADEPPLTLDYWRLNIDARKP